MGRRHAGVVAGLIALGLSARALSLQAQTQSPMVTDTEVTLDREEGPLQDLEVFGEDGPYHVWLREVVVTIRTIEGRPLTRQEKDESLSFALTCENDSLPTAVTESETSDGAFVVSFTCE